MMRRRENMMTSKLTWLLAAIALGGFGLKFAFC